MDAALGLNSTTEVRKYALQEFCPKENMSPEELRFRVRSFITGLDQLPSKSYHQLQVRRRHRHRHHDVVFLSAAVAIAVGSLFLHVK